MSWIRRESPETLAEPARSLFQHIREHTAGEHVSHLWQACALDPPGLAAVFALERALLDLPEPLTRAQVELILMVVSATNGCPYNVAHHGPRLAEALGDEKLARAVARDYREANLAARDRVLLDYAVALTCEPAERTREDIERLREYGFDDVTILKATEIAGLANLVDRLACGLGVTLEPAVAEWEFGSQR